MGIFPYFAESDRVEFKILSTFFDLHPLGYAKISNIQVLKYLSFHIISLIRNANHYFYYELLPSV